MRNRTRYTALAAAIALACGAAWAQDQEHDEPVLQEEHGVEHDVDIARGNDTDVLESRGIGDDAPDPEEVAEAVEDRQELSDERMELEQMADRAIEQLRSEDPEAAKKLDEAYGWAVFDTTKAGLIVTGAGGTGVAEVKETDEQTFMHVGGAGIGLGAGGENYKLVLVFEDEQRYDEFVQGEWEAGASAQAAAGEEGAASEAITEGVQLYRLTDAGLIAQVDLTGMKFWPSEELNGEDRDTDVALR
ncbi:MAG: hypothetical protein JXB36_14325 [Gammaproteobacteria bacterium]|nr:hypothetical protein [Gammaproteobacteria bacterium]